MRIVTILLAAILSGCAITSTSSSGPGTPGLALRLAGDGGAPILHVINIRRMALEMGLPFDPVPLPRPGLSPAVYGTATTTTNDKNRQGDMK